MDCIQNIQDQTAARRLSNNLQRRSLLQTTLTLTHVPALYQRSSNRIAVLHNAPLNTSSASHLFFIIDDNPPTRDNSLDCSESCGPTTTPSHETVCVCVCVSVYTQSSERQHRGIYAIATLPFELRAPPIPSVLLLMHKPAISSARESTDAVTGATQAQASLLQGHLSSSLKCAANHNGRVVRAAHRQKVHHLQCTILIR